MQCRRQQRVEQPRRGGSSVLCRKRNHSNPLPTRALQEMFTISRGWIMGAPPKLAAQVFCVLCFDPLLHEPNPLAPELLWQMNQFGCGTCPGLGVMGGTGGCAGEPSCECSSSHTLLPGSGTWHHQSWEGPGVFIALVNMHEWTR